MQHLILWYAFTEKCNGTIISKEKKYSLIHEIIFSQKMSNKIGCEKCHRWESGSSIGKYSDWMGSGDKVPGLGRFLVLIVTFVDFLVMGL